MPSGLYGSYMDALRKRHPVLTAASFIGLGWFWKPMRVPVPAVGVALPSLASASTTVKTGPCRPVVLAEIPVRQPVAIMWMSALSS